MFFLFVSAQNNTLGKEKSEKPLKIRSGLPGPGLSGKNDLHNNKTFYPFRKRGGKQRRKQHNERFAEKQTRRDGHWVVLLRLLWFVSLGCGQSYRRGQLKQILGVLGRGWRTLRSASSILGLHDTLDHTVSFGPGFGFGFVLAFCNPRFGWFVSKQVKVMQVHIGLENFPPLPGCCKIWRELMRCTQNKFFEECVLIHLLLVRRTPGTHFSSPNHERWIDCNSNATLAPSCHDRQT